MKRRGKTGAAQRYDEALGRRISGAREASGMKCKTLAAAVGVSEGALYNYESGLRTCPAIVLQRISEALGVPTSKLLPQFVSLLKSTPN